MASRPPQPRDLHAASDQEVQEVVRALYESVGPAVLGLGHRYFGGRRELAEELVAETFARVLMGIRRFEGRSAYRTWIFRIAMNVAAGWLRDRRRRRVDRLETEPVEGRTAPEAAVAFEQRDLVNRAVRRLSPDHRMVLSLLVTGGLAPHEVAELLGVAQGTVWSRYARARLALARELKRSTQDHGR